jgi:hypothetical protein
MPAFSVPSFFPYNKLDVLSGFVRIGQFSSFFLGSFLQAKMSANNNLYRAPALFSHDNPFASMMPQTASQKKKVVWANFCADFTNR